jgi:thiol-disulfide isomerase/thioredoxin
MKSFIDNYPKSRATLVAVEQLDMKEDMEYFEKVVENMSTIIPESDYYKNLENRVISARATTIGAMAPDITLPNPQGEEMSLSDLRGNYVLLDFWAAWCRPCRAENPNVVEMYNTYKDQGFKVFSVSLDGVPAQQGKGKELWMQAIEQDGLVWPTHVSDLQGWTSIAARQYNVNSIPFSLLIDPDGKIIDKNLRGQQLRSRLSVIFE